MSKRRSPTRAPDLWVAPAPGPTLRVSERLQVHDDHQELDRGIGAIVHLAARKERLAGEGAAARRGPRRKRGPVPGPDIIGQLHGRRLGVG